MEVFGDFSKNNGTTVRAKKVFETLNEHSDMTIIASVSADTSFPKTKIVKLPSYRQFVQLPFWWSVLFLELLKRRFDVIYCSNDWFGFLPCYLISKVHRCSIIFEAHGILSEEYAALGRWSLSRFGRHWERFVISHSKAVIALSNGINKFYSEFNGNVSTIPVYVNTEVFMKTAKKTSYLKRVYGLSGYKVVGLIGPIDSKWNRRTLDFLYENIDQFDKRIKFLLIGKSGIKIKAHERIVYAGYVEDYVETLSLLDAVLVAPNVSTSGPLNKIIEPMSCSLPVFVTPHGAVGLDYADNMKNIFILKENEIVKRIN